MYMINHSLNKDVLDTGIIVSDPLDAGTTNDVDSYVSSLPSFLRSLLAFSPAFPPFSPPASPLLPPPEHLLVLEIDR